MQIQHTHTHTHPFNGPFSGTTQVSRYQKGGTNLDFTEARDSEWQWHQLGQMQVCTLLQTDNHTSIPPLSFLQAGCPSCRPTNSVKALNANTTHKHKQPLTLKLRPTIVAVYFSRITDTQTTPQWQQQSNALHKFAVTVLIKRVCFLAVQA